MHSNSIRRYSTPLEMKTYYPHKTYRMFTAALFIIPRKWKQVNVHQMMNGQTKYGIPTQQIIIWPLKRMKCIYMLHDEASKHDT